MARSRRRTALRTAPIVLTLLALALLGLTEPRLIAPGPGPTFYGWAVLLIGVATIVTLFHAALRCPPGLRTSWFALAVMSAFWTASVLGALGGVDDVLVWGVLRGLTAASGVAVLASVPTIRRGLREWGLILLDGWLVGGSVLVIGWVALAYSGSSWSELEHTPPALFWVPVDLLFASVVTGLAMRTPRRNQRPVLLIVLVAMLTVTGDSTWALTGRPEFALVEWLVLMYALAYASGARDLDLWRTPTERPAHPRLIRWSQVAVVPGLIAALMNPTDPVVVAAAVSVVFGMAAEIVLVSHQNQHLWHATHAQAQRLNQLISDSRDAIVVIDPGGTIRFANDAVADVLGCAPSCLLGHNVLARIHPEDRDAVVEQVGRLAGGRRSVRISGRVRHDDGTWRHLETTVSSRSGQDAGFTLLARDVSERTRLEAELRHLATTDTLTGLANRYAFTTLLAERLAQGPAAVLFVDLDGFKAVNDLDGHAVGDRLLQETGEAINARLETSDVAARLGGDEFAVITSRTDRSAVERLAGDLSTRLRQLPSDVAHRTSASVGVALADGGTDAESLLRDADLAMYAAKVGGGGRFAVFGPDLCPDLPARGSSVARRSGRAPAPTTAQG